MSSYTPVQQSVVDNINAWQNDTQNSSNDWTMFTQAIKKIMGGGNSQQEVDERFMEISLALGGALQCQGDGVTVAAGLMNIGSSSSAVETEITNALTQIQQTNNDTKDATTLLSDLKFLQGQMENQLPGANGAPAVGPVWADQGTASAVLSAVNGLLKQLGGSNATPTSVAALVNGWANNPNTKDGTGQTGEQQLSTLNGSLSTVTNAFGGYSQMENNAIQFLNGQLGQVVSAFRSIVQSIVTENKGSVANQKGS
jgi:hypothetical protein